MLVYKDGQSRTSETGLNGAAGLYIQPASGEIVLGKTLPSFASQRRREWLRKKGSKRLPS